MLGQERFYPGEILTGLDQPGFGLGRSGFGAGVGCLERVIGHDPFYDGVMSDKHAGIMARLPFGQGLTAEMLSGLLKEAGYTNVHERPHAPITAAQRRNASLRNRLRTLFYRRFVVVAERPQSSQDIKPWPDLP